MAAIAPLGERQTEDLKVPGSIPGLGKFHRMIGTLRECVPWRGKTNVKIKISRSTASAKYQEYSLALAAT